MRSTTITALILLVVAALAAAATLQSSAGAQSGQLSAETEALVPGYSELRTGYGFDGGPDRVRELLQDSGVRAIAEEVGMPLTSEELEEFNRRQAFGVDIVEVAEWAKQQPGYAGERIAHDLGGGLVIYSTSDFDTTAMPTKFDNLAYPIYFEPAITDFETLKAAASDLIEMTRTEELSGVHAVSIDVRANALVAEIDVNDTGGLTLDGKTTSAEALASRTGVDVSLEYTSVPVATSCNARNDCWSPDFKAGILMRMKAPGTSGPRCTMGFHVKVNGTTDEQFLMSGHCVEEATEPFDRAYHETYNGYPSDPGRVGKLKDSAYDTVTGGYDFGRWQMKDGRKSNDIYGSASNHQVLTHRHPFHDDYVCASLGRTNTVDCGYVDISFKYYTHDHCTAPQCSMTGATATGILTKLGDSGAPVYYPYWEFGQAWAQAVGVHSAKSSTTITFARVVDAVQPHILNVTIYGG